MSAPVREHAAPRSWGVPSLDERAPLPAGLVVELRPETGLRPADTERSERAARMLSLRAICAAQAAGHYPALLDAGGHFDPREAEEAGVDLGGLILAQPENGATHALDLALRLVRSGAFGLLVVWSDVPQDHGLALRALAGSLAFSATGARPTALFVPSAEGLFAPTAALQYYASLRVRVKAERRPGPGGVWETRARVVKATVATGVRPSYDWRPL